MNISAIENLPVEYQEMAKVEGLRAVEELLSDSPASLSDVAKLQAHLEQIAHPWSLEQGDPVIQLDALPHGIPAGRLPYHLQEYTLNNQIKKLAREQAREHYPSGGLVAILFLVAFAAGVAGIIF